VLDDEARVGDERRFDASAKTGERAGEQRRDQQRLEREQRGDDEQIDGKTTDRRESRLRDPASMSDASVLEVVASP
jgi:hypothetical protein